MLLRICLSVCVIHTYVYARVWESSVARGNERVPVAMFFIYVLLHLKARERKRKKKFVFLDLAALTNGRFSWSRVTYTTLHIIINDFLITLSHQIIWLIPFSDFFLGFFSQTTTTLPDFFFFLHTWIARNFWKIHWCVFSLAFWIIQSSPSPSACYPRLQNTFCSPTRGLSTTDKFELKFADSNFGYPPTTHIPYANFSLLTFLISVVPLVEHIS